MDRLIKLVVMYQQSQNVDEQSRFMDTLVDEIVPHLHKYLQGRLRREDVEDVLQEALAAVLQALEGFEGKSDRQFWAFCYRIASRRVADAWRKWGRSRSDVTVSLDEKEVRRAAEKWITDESVSAQDRLDVEYVMKLVGSVKPPCHDYLHSRFYLELEFEEIGRKHGISADGARVAVERCRKLAEKLLGE